MRFPLKNVSLPALWWGGLSGGSFGICAALLITDNRLPQILVIVSLFIVGCIAGSVSGTALSVAGGLAAAGVLVSGVDHLPGGPQIPMWAAAVGSLLLIALVSFVVREFEQSTQLIGYKRSLELVALAAAFILVNRWPLKLPLDHLTFASYEDNAAWISTAANFRNGQYSSGLGGFVLDPLMGTLHFATVA